MRVLLLSTALGEKAFAEVVQSGHPRNPASQNFYFRLFEALQTSCETLSIAPLPCSAQEENGMHIAFFRPYRLDPWAGAKALVKKAESLSWEHPDVILYDSLNLQCVKAAIALEKKWAPPAIPVLTDDPSNITGTGRAYRFLAKRLSRNRPAYLGLTDGLNDAFNPKKKPFLRFFGIADDFVAYPSPVKGPFFYYGGALYEKDGVGSLLRSYERSKTTIPFYFAGHGPMASLIQETAKSDDRIHFLGQIDRARNAAFQQHALIVFNARHYRESLDLVSLPSKDLEYLANAARIALTPSRPLMKEFPEDALWLPEGIDELENELLSIFDQDGANVPENRAKEKIASLIGKEAIGKRIKDFLKSL